MNVFRTNYIANINGEKHVATFIYPRCKNSNFMFII